MPTTCPSVAECGALHASAAAWCGNGVLLLGPPAAGKSSLLAGLLAAGAYLVADDLVRLSRRGRTLLARSVTPAGLIELRGNGIFRLVTTSAVPVRLCVELERPEGQERLPERRATTVGGVEVPYLTLAAPGEAGVARILVALVAFKVS